MFEKDEHWNNFYPVYKLRTVKSLAVERTQLKAAVSPHIAERCSPPQIKGHVPQLPKTESESTEPNPHLKGHVPQLPKTESKSTSSESKSQSVDSDGAEEVKQWLKK